MSADIDPEEGETMQMQSLTDVLADQLGDLYSAERQLVKALPNVAKAAHSDELREAFEHHLEETQEHVARLERIFADTRVQRVEEHCEGMEGLIREGEQIVAATGDPAAKDAALIAAAQRIEHYEIAGYGTARTLAEQLDLPDTKDLLDQTLDEEGKADKLLSKIATGPMFRSGINEAADN
jgi:ferritin-like metal-binding protein YciE